MHVVKTSLIALFVLSLAVPALGQKFQVYPGAKLDEKTTSEMRDFYRTHGKSSPAARGLKPSLYTTGDAFEKVVAFYQGIAKEYRMSGHTGKGQRLPTGQELQEVFFIFDGAQDLISSKLWIKVQRPYVGDMELKEIRDETAIVVSEKE